MPLVRVRVTGPKDLLGCTCGTKNGAAYYEACLENCAWASSAKEPLFNELASGIVVKRSNVIAGIGEALREWKSDFPSFIESIRFTVKWRGDK